MTFYVRPELIFEEGSLLWDLYMHRRAMGWVKTGRESSWRLMLHEKDIPAGQEQDRPPGEMFKDTYDLHQESTFEYF